MPLLVWSRILLVLTESAQDIHQLPGPQHCNQNLVHFSFLTTLALPSTAVSKPSQVAN